jgi:preprotein translocase subunit SecA
MLRGLISKVVGDSNEKEIGKLQPLVEAINGLEPEMERRSDAELRALTDQFRLRLTAGETLDEVLVEAFALVRETAKRTVDMRPFDVQLIGGLVLHQGKVAEMKTGEGKTLVATMPLYLNALLGQGVHLVTVNDYLARCSLGLSSQPTCTIPAISANPIPACARCQGARPMGRTSPMAPTTSSALTTCATTWHSI